MSEVKLIQHSDDPICTRISAGGKPEIGYYCVFRGDKTDVISCLEKVLEALKNDVPVKYEEG